MTKCRCTLTDITSTQYFQLCLSCYITSLSSHQWINRGIERYTTRMLKQHSAKVSSNRKSTVTHEVFKWKGSLPWPLSLYILVQWITLAIQRERVRTVHHLSLIWRPAIRPWNTWARMASCCMGYQGSSDGWLHAPQEHSVVKGNCGWIHR